MQLVIGNKNYSTWSLRPWLLLKAFGVEFEEVQESLMHEGIKARLGRYSPTSRVPVLIDGELRIWDSLAICEYVSEAYLEGRGWPAGLSERAQARALVAEMHSGFSALRNELPMNLRAKRKVVLSAAAKEDISRVEQIFSATDAGAAQGPWLFGEFGIVDCFYAPLALRLPTYSVVLEPRAEAYAEQLRSHPQVLEWLADSRADNEIVAEDEAGEPS